LVELQIIFIGSPADEVDAMVDRLRDAGVTARWLRVDDEQGLRAALENGRWELAILDWDAPGEGLDGPGVCTLVARLSPATAVIALDATLPDPHADRGIVEHVPKEDPARLLFAAGRAAGLAEWRRMETELHETLFDMSSLYGQAPFAYHSLDAEGLVVRMNDTGLAWLGYGREEVIGRLHITDMMTPDSRAAFALTFPSFKAEGRIAGLEFTFVRKDGSTFPGLVNATAIRDPGGRYMRSLSTVVDISEQVAAREEVRRTAQQLRRTVEGTILAMSNVVEARDPYTAGHERRVSELCVAIGKEMGMAEDDLEGLRLGALIHDIGKIAVPAEILAKPGRLSEIEFTLVEQHSPSGFDILQAIEFSWPIADMVLQHHERLDGSGYPAGLTAEAILPEAKILAVADVVEAMSSHRPYRAALGIDAALTEVRENAGVKYDAAVAAACATVVAQRDFAFTA
jgi:PAS domain S-box-containing protein